MSNINTQCKGCVFARCNQVGFQLGCTVGGRADKLGVKEVKDGGYQLSRFCNTYRPKEWLETLDFEEQLNPELVALDEVYPRIGFFVKFDTKEENAIQALELTLKSICQLTKKAAYVVVINDKVEYNEEIWGLFISNFGEISDTKYHLMQRAENSEEITACVDAAFGHAENGWIMCVSSGMHVESDTTD